MVDLVKAKVPSQDPDRGTLNVLQGRGRSGKTTTGRWMVERANAGGRSVRIADADINNASLLSFYPHSSRLLAQDAETVVDFLLNLTAEVVDQGGSTLLDLAGGDRTFMMTAEKYEMFKVLPANGIQITSWFFLTGGRDDAEQLTRMLDSGLVSKRIVIVLNLGLAPSTPGVDPFKETLETKTLRRAASEFDAKIVRLPRIDLGILAAADRLFIPFGQAAAGGVPLGKDGKPHPAAQPLSFWQRVMLKRWLDEVEKAHHDAGVTEWLP